MDPKQLLKPGVYHGHINAFKPKYSIKSMLKSLLPDENVLFVTPCNVGNRRGALTLTDKQVIFTANTIFRTILRKNILFKDIIGVTYNKGAAVSELIIETPAESLRFSRIGKRHIGENLAYKINEQRIKATHSTQPIVIQPQASADLEDLEYLASMKEKGIITPEEFDLKKKQILGL
ncbi:MAG: PH domain-containing protein [Candidatus Azobacteroides sp.]|nr:PH domain-containing protein [Candidatus Azobacteroides sp.]